MIMRLFALLYDVERVRFAVTREIFRKTGLFGLCRDVVRRFQRFLVLHRFLEHFVPSFGILEVYIIVLFTPRLMFGDHLLQNRQVPVVNLSGFAVVLEPNGHVLALGVYVVKGIGDVMAVVVRIGWQFDDEHVRIIRPAVMSGLHCQAFPVMGVRSPDLLHPDFREQVMVFRVRLALRYD